tara:strand:+ start:271 stop:444 length:174 start_codon:yes stop_codon:yes gene_type:complete
MFGILIDTIKEKLSEVSSWNGGMFIGTGVLIMIGSPILHLIAYAAIIYGAYLILKKG